MNKRCILLIAVVLLLQVIMSGCGGGFDSDSDNAKNLERSLFGPDSSSVNR